MNLEVVKDYYGKVLKSSKDLKTSACCDGGEVPADLEALLANVHEEVRAKYYGCGIVVPAALAWRPRARSRLGIGPRRLSHLPVGGPEGEVVGVDMTDEQLATANAHIDWHMRQFGYARRNVKFLKGYIEKLGELGLAPASFDVIVSNCVINLSVDKLAVLRGAYDLLEAGRRALFRRCLLRPAAPRRRQGRSLALWRVPRRRALLERFSPDGEAGRFPRSAAGDEPADRGRERGDAGEARPGASSSRRPTGCSSSTGSSRPARITARR